MLHILLIILKIVGIIILVILGIIILLLLQILLIPIKYTFCGEYYGEPKGEIRVKWLLFVIDLRIIYENSDFAYYLRSFNGIIYTNKDLEPSLLGKLIRKLVSKYFDDDNEEENEKDETSLPEDKHKDIHNKPDKTFDDVKTEHIKTEVVNTYDDLDNWINEEQIQKGSTDSDTETIHENTGDNIFEPIEDRVNFLDRWKESVDNIKSITYSIRQALKKASTTKDKIILIIKFINKDSTKTSLSSVKIHLLKLWKHIRPRKVSGLITFGFDDPYQTGQVLGLLALFIPVYKNNIKIRPDFNESRFEGNISGSGRIILGYLLSWGIHIIRDRQLMVTIKRARKLLGGD